MTALVIFLGAVTLCLALFAVFALLDKRSDLRLTVKSGSLELELPKWRQRLNTITARWVALGEESLLSKAASMRNDPVVPTKSGTTLSRYQEIKNAYLALSYAYNGGAQSVRRAETGLRAPIGVRKAFAVHRAQNLADTRVTIKEIRADYFRHFVKLPNNAAQPPEYMPGYLLDVCEALLTYIEKGVREIKEAPAAAQAQKAACDSALAACAERNGELAAAGLQYAPYADRAAAMQTALDQLAANQTTDPMGTATALAAHKKSIDGFGGELQQIAQLQKSLKGGQERLEGRREWLQQVRSTHISCPWRDAPAGEPPCWRLDHVDTNPEPMLRQAETLLARALELLASGNSQLAESERRQAVALMDQGDKLAQASFDAKNAVDEQVPRVRAELTAIHTEVHGVTGGRPNDMQQLVAQACDAVEQRLAEVRTLYDDQQFVQSLSVLTGQDSNQYGMPISKLLAQAKELLRLLKQAAEVAGNVQAQLQKG